MSLRSDTPDESATAQIHIPRRGSVLIQSSFSLPWRTFFFSAALHRLQMSASVKMDDRHPQIRYSMNGEWIYSGKHRVEYNSTTTGTKIGGATVTIPFNGMPQ